jgi:hypothetical protein
MKFFLSAILLHSLLITFPAQAALKAYDNNNTPLTVHQKDNRIEVALPTLHQSRALTAKIIALAGTGLTYLLGSIYEKSAHHASTNQAMSMSQQGMLIKISSQIVAILLGVSILKQSINQGPQSHTVTVELEQ